MILNTTYENQFPIKATDTEKVKHAIVSSEGTKIYKESLAPIIRSLWKQDWVFSKQEETIKTFESELYILKMDLFNKEYKVIELFLKK